MTPERLQKVLARRGLASRREAEEWILQGRVSVNGQRVQELGTRVDPDADRVEVDGVPIPAERAPVVILLNKPAGYVTTVRDPHAEHTVMELLGGLGRRVYPVGRLDKDTRGVLVLTDDGDLAHDLLHPSKGVEKVYEVTASGELAEGALEKLAAGVELEDGHVTRPVRVSRVRQTASGVRFRLALKEGRKRQVRQMVRAVGGHVAELERVSFGGLTAGDLPEGSWRVLKKEEVERLRRSTVEPPPKRRSGPAGGRGARAGESRRSDSKGARGSGAAGHRKEGEGGRPGSGTRQPKPVRGIAERRKANRQKAAKRVTKGDRGRGR